MHAASIPGIDAGKTLLIKLPQNIGPTADPPEITQMKNIADLLNFFFDIAYDTETEKLSNDVEIDINITDAHVADEIVAPMEKVKIYAVTRKRTLSDSFRNLRKVSFLQFELTNEIRIL